MGGQREADEGFDWHAEPLPDRQVLRPLRHWPSRRPLSVLVLAFLVPVWPAFVIYARPTTPGLVALMTALTGFMALVALVRRLNDRFRSQARDDSPLEPWAHDHDWDERGETRTWLVRIAEAVGGGTGWRRQAAVVLCVAGAMLVVLRMWTAAATVLSALATLLATAAWRAHGLGDSHLTFSKFPFHPGERMTLFFGMGTGGASFRCVEFRLAQVEEFKGGLWGLQRGTRRGFTGFERRPPGVLPGPDLDVEVSFDVPESAPGSRICDPLPRYWVLEVRGTTTSGPYMETFLVPIYARPAPDDEVPGP